MSKPLATPIEQLLADKTSLDCDVLVIGSGYGGSFAALELGSPNRKVWVLERGKEYVAGDFPETIGDLPGHVQFRAEPKKSPTDGEDSSKEQDFRGYADALFRITGDADAMALSGCGLGGTSLINAGVVLEPSVSTLTDQRWPRSLRDDPKEFTRIAAEVKSILGAKAYPNAAKFGKYQALEKLACSLGAVEVSPADIAVTSVTGKNNAGVHQKACIECGNCVTGCNHLAKNTLPMNVIPLAVSRGVKFFTGGTAVRLSKVDVRAEGPANSAIRPRRWRIDFVRTAALKNAQSDIHNIRADWVIVAAGTLGTLDLLLKSREAGLPISKTHLGKRFSTNGDFLAFGFAQTSPVDAVAQVLSSTPAKYKPVGPTIVGAILPTDRNQRLAALGTVQDAAVPTALNRLIGSLIGIAALPHAYVHKSPPGYYKRFPDLDPLANGDAVFRHTQFLLGMGSDCADGTIECDEHRRLRIRIPIVARDPALAGIHKQLREASGFDGGYYLANPLWKPLPEGSAEVSGNLPSSTVTVHPLGGCVMGENATIGVVDQWGAMFDVSKQNAQATHIGLHVLDGSIVPVPVGVNPLLTIATLSIRAARHIAAQMGNENRSNLAHTVLRQYENPIVRSFQPTPNRDVQIEFTEVLHSKQQTAIVLGRLAELLPDEHLKKLKAGTAGIALKITVRNQLFDWLEKPHSKWQGTAELGTYDFTRRYEEPKSTETIAGDALFDEVGKYPRSTGFGDPPVFAPFACGEIDVTIFDQIRESELSKLAQRVQMAGSEFIHRRGSDFSFTATPPVPESIEEPLSFLGRLGYWLRVGAIHALWRGISYEARLKSLASDKNGRVRSVRVHGEKQLAYAWRKRSVWESLLEIDMNVEVDGRRDGQLALSVDTLALLRRNVYQLSNSPDTPTSIAGLIGVGTLWLKSILSTSYWTFRGLDYKHIEVPAAFARLSCLELVDGTRVEPVETRFKVPRRAEDHDKPGSEQITIRLSRYRKAGSHGHPVLFIHGIAHGGEVFTTNTIKRNMASYFVERGYDVFVLDHRFSNFLGDLPRQKSNIDDLGFCDIPGAVDQVLRLNGAEKTDVIAHCIGAAGFSIACLSGKLSNPLTSGGKPTSRISAVVLHAVNPWVIPSKWNRVSAALGAVFQDALGEEVIEAIPPRESKTKDQLIDRLAASIPWPEDELAMHLADQSDDRRGTAICNRMTLFYGREWVHSNLAPKTHSELHRLVGPVHIDVFRHIFFTVLRQRITDRHGNNSYLNHDNLESHWIFPTLFACGEKNAVFSAESTARAFVASYAIRTNESWLLTDKSPAAQLGYFVPPGVGHMDFLFGQHCAEPIGDPLSGQSKPGSGVYETLFRFLRHRKLHKDNEFNLRLKEAVSRSPAFYAETTPLIGPLIDYQIQQADSEGDKQPEIRLKIRELYSIRPYHTGQLAPQATAVKNTVHSEKNITLEWAEFVNGLPKYENDKDRIFQSPESSEVYRTEWTLNLSQLPSPEGLSSVIDTTIGTADVSLLRNFQPETGEAVKKQVAQSKGISLSTTLARRPWFDRLSAYLLRGERPEKLRVLVASCRWPGLGSESIEIDRTFGWMATRASDGGGLDGVWLLGDQIYSDALADMFDVTETAERAMRRYRAAFANDNHFDEHYDSASFRTLLASVPSRLLVDDHEIEDNWDGVDDLTKMSLAFKARLAAASVFSRRQSTGKEWSDLQLWESFDVVNLRCFAFDSRIERKPRTDANWRTAQMISDKQRLGFEEWQQTLPTDREFPLCLLSGIPVGVPFRDLTEHPSLARNSDGWDGRPADYEWLLQSIVNTNRNDFVLIGGDLHLSVAVELQIHDKKRGVTVRAISLVASGLNSTLPFANTRRRDIVEGRWVRVFESAAVACDACAFVMSESQRQIGLLEFSAAKPGVESQFMFKVIDGQSESEVSVKFEGGRRIA